MSWLYYLLEANLYLCLFYAGYYLLLSRETYYTANRAYLLMACAVAFIIPLLQLGFLKPVEQMAQQVVFVNTPITTLNIVEAVPVKEAFHISWQQVVIAIYLLGVAASVILFSIKLYKLRRIIGNNPKTTAGNYTIIHLNENNTAFSFFNYLFIGRNINGADTITRHELVHIKQKHSFDIIFMELIKAVNWFNPMIYMLQISLKNLHEYIADAQTAMANNTLDYSTFLLNNAYGMQGLAPAHSFFNYNLLKKRIIMLNQQPSGSLAGLKYLLAVPLCGAMLCASTLSFSKDYAMVDLLPNTKNEQNNALNITPVATSPGITLAQPVKITGVNGATSLPVLENAGKINTLNVPDGVFDELGDYIMKNAKYPEAARENDIQGNVYIKFTIGNNNKISSAGLVKGLPYKCGENIIASLPSYPKTINAKPGTYYAEMTFVFLEQVDANNFTADGRAIQESETDPVTPHFKTIIIVNKKGAKYAGTVATPVKPDTTKTYGRIHSYGPGIDNLGGYVTKHTKYPEAGLDKQLVGNVVLKFKVNADNSISDINVAESPGEEFDKNAIAALKSYPESIKKTAGNYTLMVQFILMSKDQSTVKGPGMPALTADDKVLVSQIFGDLKTNKTEAFSGLLKYMGDNIKYPAEARKNKTGGTLTVTFRLDKNGKIENKFKIGGGLKDRLPESVLESIKNYGEKIDQKPGLYKVAVRFAIVNDSDRSITGDPVPDSQMEGENAGEITIMAFVK